MANWRNFFLIFIAGVIMGSNQLIAEELEIIPKPQSFRWGETKCDFSNLQKIRYVQRDQKIAGTIIEYFQDFSGATLVPSSGIPQELESGAIYLLSISDLHKLGFDKLAEDLQELSNDEAYLLHISRNYILIAAATERGRFYGAMSLKQIMRTNSSFREITIFDYPAMKFRGVSDDISRGQVSSLDDFKKIIRFLAEFKMNTYMPYLEDMVKFKTYPSIGKERGALSPEEIKALQEYAKEYFIEVIPIFQTLGHYENILNQPEFVKYAEYPGAASLNIQSPQAFQFLTNLLSEVIPLFESGYFHIGADESWDVGRGASSRKVARYDIATVHAEHYNRVFDLVKKYGKKIIMYGDIVLQNPTILNMIPDDVIIMDWHYWATDSYSSAEILAKYNQPFIVSPGIHNWRRFYPDNTSAWLNIYYLTLEGYRNGALGSIISNWGDYGGVNLRALNYRGYAFGAECSWNPEHADGKTINTRFNTQFFGKNLPELAAIDNLLSRITRDTDFKKIWEHPFYASEKNPNQILTKAREMKENSSAVLSLIEKIKGTLPYNNEYLDYFCHVAKFAKWYGERIEYTRWIENISEKYILADEREKFIPEGVGLGKKLAGECDNLFEEFSELWLRTNKRDNLQRIKRLFDYQKAYLEEMAAAIGKNSWSVQSECPSQFISVQNAREKGTKDVYLRTAFNIPGGKKIKAAYLQIMGDTQVKIWVNGKSAGEVYSTKSLSLMVEMKRVHYQDVSKFLKKGVNSLAVHVHSYHETRPASANIYLEIHFTDGTVKKVLSDEYWKAATREFENWKDPEFDDRYWLPVEIVEYPWKVAAPLFQRGLPARIEF